MGLLPAAGVGGIGAPAANAAVAVAVMNARAALRQRAIRPELFAVNCNPGPGRVKDLWFIALLRESWWLEL